MGLLLQATSGRSVRPRRVMLYGTHGVGKSSWAAQAHNAIFIPTEDGLGEIDCVKLPIMTSFDMVMQAIAELYTEKHDRQTAVIDSLDWLEQLIWAEVAKSSHVDNIEKIGYAKGYTYALTYWRKFLDGLQALRNDRGMFVVLLAHCQIVKFEDPETDNYDRYCPRLHKYASAMVQEWCDEVLFANYKTYTKATEEGFNQKSVKGVGSGERVVKTTQRPAHVAKNRLNLPDELPLLWEAYAAHFTRGG